MKTHRLFSWLALLSAGLASAACHQADPDPAGCQLVYSELASPAFTYFYNEAGQLTALRTLSTGYFQSEVHYDYSYASQQVMLDLTYPQSDFTRLHYDITLNAQGFATQIEGTFSLALGNGGWQSHHSDTYRFGYDAANHLTSFRHDYFTQPLSSGVQTTTYQAQLTYKGGNIDQIVGSITDPPPAPRQDYVATMQYSSQPNRLRLPLLLESKGNPCLAISEGLLPFIGRPTDHLVSGRQWQNGALLANQTYTYLLDATGQVTQGQRGATSFTYSSNCP